MASSIDPFKYDKYFGQFGGSYNNGREIDYFDKQQAEYAAIYGIPINYYTINVDDYKEGMDIIYGENSTPVWDRKFQMKALLDEYSQEMVQWQGAGQIGTDEITLFIHKSTYDQLVGQRSALTPGGPERRGGYGPITRDMIMTTHNNIVYEVITGGVHFMDSSAQLFGHKFWYKCTLKQREVSPAQIGAGEQYGALPDLTIEELMEAGIIGDGNYVCNPQGVVDKPCGPDGTPIECPNPNDNLGDCPDYSTWTNGSQTCDTSASPEVCPDYTTSGSGPAYEQRPLNGGTPGPSGDEPSNVPDDVFLPDGRLNMKYDVPGAKQYSDYNDGPEIQETADQIVDPQTDMPIQEPSRAITFNQEGSIVYTDTGEMVPEGSSDYNMFMAKWKYGPNGRVIRNNRDLWGDW